MTSPVATLDAPSNRCFNGANNLRIFCKGDFTAAVRRCDPTKTQSVFGALNRTKMLSET